MNNRFSAVIGLALVAIIIGVLFFVGVDLTDDGGGVTLTPEVTEEPTPEVTEEPTPEVTEEPTPEVTEEPTLAPVPTEFETPESSESGESTPILPVMTATDEPTFPTFTPTPLG